MKTYAAVETADGRCGSPNAVLIVLFFGVTFAAMWPCLYRDAPYSFWIFASVYWVGGAVLMLLLKFALTAW